MAGADSKFGKKEQEEKDGRKLLKLFVAHNALKIQKNKQFDRNISLHNSKMPTLCCL